MSAVAQLFELNNPGVGVERSLPAHYYTEADILDYEKEQLFFRNWHYVCHRSALGAPGKYLTVQFFDQEFLLVCDADAEIRAYYNVCPHRAHKLAEGRGEKRSIVCPYHHWTFDLGGQLKGVRGADDKQSFAKTDICLSEVRVEQLLGFVFINLDPQAESLSSYAAGLEEQVLAVVPDLDSYRLVEGADHFGGGYQANWKVLMDNFLECYHCEAAHPSFVDMLRIQDSTFTFHGNFSHQVVPCAVKDSYQAFPLDHAEDATTGHFWYLFPNITLQIFPGVKSFSVSRCDPLAVDRTVRYFDVLVAPNVNQERLQARAEWGMQVVNEEDKSLCENVQVGLQQRGFSQGYYIVQPDNGNITEEAVQFFHRHYARSMMGKVSAGMAS